MEVKINCSYDDKDLVKSCGGKYNGEGKYWFIDAKYIKMDNFEKLCNLIEERKHSKNKIEFNKMTVEEVTRKVNGFKSKFKEEQNFKLIKDCYLSESD